MLNIDTTHQLRSPAQLRELVLAIVAAGHADESEAIEWKGTLDLSTKAGLAHVVRAILGFANREPIAARRMFDGLAYLIVGAEPGQLKGVAEMDLADLDNKMRAYLGDPAPRWSGSWVHEDGVACLVVLIEPPEPGDPMWILQKEIDGLPASRVFVRHPAKTEPATPADMAMLQRRLLQRADRLGLRVEYAAEPPTVTSVDVSPSAIDAWLRDMDRDLMASLELHQRASQTQSPGEVSPASMGISLGHLQGLLAGLQTVPEKRTENEYIKQVDEYLQQARAILGDVALSRAPSRAAPLALVVVNETERNFADVRFAIRVAGTVMGVGAEGFDEKHMPTRPRPFGTPTPSHAFGSLAAASLVNMRHVPVGGLLPSRPRPIIDNEASVSITWPQFDLRPDGTKKLQAVTLLALGSPGETLTLEWSATASDATGVARGTLPLLVAEHPIEPLDLVER